MVWDILEVSVIVLVLAGSIAGCGKYRWYLLSCGLISLVLSYCTIFQFGLDQEALNAAAKSAAIIGVLGWGQANGHFRPSLKRTKPGTLAPNPSKEKEA